MLRPTKTVLVAAVLTLSNLAANPQKIDKQVGSSTPTLKVYSRETVVDITVTEKNGKPVHGLKQSDFSVTEDGKPQRIRSFQEFGQENRAETPAPLKLPAHVYTNLQTATGPLNVVLFDDINDGDIVQARWAARDFIKDMAPGTRVALLALGDRLTVLQGPTTDSALLLKVVSNAVKPYFVQAIGCTKQVVLDWATLDQLHLVATYLSGIKGRKNLIWIGKGIPDMIFSTCQDWKLPLQQTYDLLEDAEVTVYPLDPDGVGFLGPRQLAMEAVAESTGGTAYYENNDMKSLMAKAVEAGSSYYTLSYVTPSLAYDGKYHAIAINIERPDMHLLYRKGYSTEDPTQLAHAPETILGVKIHEKTQLTEAPANPLATAMSPVTPPATQLLFDVRVDPTTTPPNPTDPSVLGQLDSKLKKLALTRYNLLFALPQSQIAFSDLGGGNYSGSLTFEVAAFDPDGRLETIRSQTMPLALTNGEYREFIQKPFQFFLQLDLPPGQSTLRVGILDAVSNKLGTVEIPLTVPKR